MNETTLELPEIELPGPIEDLIVHAMAEDPGERVQTAREFRQKT